MFFRILHFVEWKHSHCINILKYLLPGEVWDGDLRQVNDKEFFDQVPVFDVTLSLRNVLDELDLLFLFLGWVFEHGFQTELARVQLVKQFPLFCQSLDSLLFSIAAVVLFSDGLHQRLKIHHFSFGPISNMLKRILQLNTKIVNLIL